MHTSIPKEPDFNQYTILVVDDDVNNLTIMNDYLETSGFKVFVATNGKLGLKRAKLVKPDLLLLDVMMPEMDGFETCRRLKADSATREIPVIFMTSMIDVGNKVTGFGAGAVDYVAKPIQQEEMFARITTHLQISQLTQSLQAQTEVLSKRTAQLEISNQIGRQLTSILDFDKLLQQIVNLLQTKFDYYYVLVYLLDEAGQYMEMVKGAGSIGASLKEQGHRIPITTVSLVTKAANSGEIVIANDVSQTKDWLPNPFLPETRSEIAVPIAIKGQVIGVLDVQSDEIAGLGEDDADLLRSLSSQVAVAIENARLYEQAQEEISERMRAEEQLRAYAAEIRVLNERLKEENMRMEAELEVTRQLQQILLPTAEELGQIEGLDIAGFMEPAEEIGGDYYDVLQHNGQVKISIGDVTGHGLESGVVMLMTQTAVRTLLTNEERDPVRFLDALNRTLRDNMQRMDVDKNLSLTLLDFQLGQMSLKASGQHEQLLVVRHGGQVEMIDTQDLGFPLGLEPEIARFVKETSIDLQPGDGIVLYSDGIIEAENAAGEFYGLGRLREVVSGHWAGVAEAIKDAVVADTRAFIGEQTVYDDLTLLVIKQQ